ncbi:MAG: base excision DNA repair protein [Terracidiphilus sp.]
MVRGKADGHRGSVVRLRRMHDWLERAYGPQHWWPAKTPFEVVLGAYLTQNTSWKAVEQSLRKLRRAGVLTIDGIRRLSVGELQELIRPSGFYTRKAPALKAFVAMLDAEFGGSLEVLAAVSTEKLRARLLALPGVGLETADAILLYALGHAVPVGDEYLRRVVERHALLAEAPRKNRSGYESLVALTREAFAGDSARKHRHLYGEFHALIVAVGKAHCSKQPACAGCPLARDPHSKAEV